MLKQKEKIEFQDFLSCFAFFVHEISLLFPETSYSIAEGYDQTLQMNYEFLCICSGWNGIMTYGTKVDGKREQESNNLEMLVNYSKLLKFNKRMQPILKSPYPSTLV